MKKLLFLIIASFYYGVVIAAIQNDYTIGLKEEDINFNSALSRINNAKQIYKIPALKTKNFVFEKKILVDVHTADILEQIDHYRLNVCEHLTYTSLNGKIKLFIYKYSIKTNSTNRIIKYCYHLTVIKKTLDGYRFLGFYDDVGDEGYGDGVFEIKFFQ